MLVFAPLMVEPALQTPTSWFVFSGSDARKASPSLLTPVHDAGRPGTTPETIVGALVVHDASAVAPATTPRSPMSNRIRNPIRTGRAPRTRPARERSVDIPC